VELSFIVSRMKSLWFKNEYVQPILSGDKKDTIRKSSNHLPKIGEEVELSVGPARVFAKALILSIAPIGALSKEREQEVVKIYGSLENLVCVAFNITQRI